MNVKLIVISNLFLLTGWFPKNYQDGYSIMHCVVRLLYDIFKDVKDPISEETLISALLYLTSLLMCFIDSHSLSILSDLNVSYMIAEVLWGSLDLHVIFYATT